MIAMEDQSRKLQVVRAGSTDFAISADEIAAITDWQTPTPLPHAPESILGVVSIHGRILTVINPRKLAGLQGNSNEGLNPQHVVALKGDEQLALAVDAIGETFELAQSEFEALGKEETGLMLGRLHRGGTETGVINVKQLFAHAIQGRERRRRRF